MTSKCLKMITLLNGKSSHENVFKKPIDYSQTDSDEFDEIINSINKQKRKKTSRNYEMDSDTKNLRAHIFDWLIIVSKKINHSNQSYFLATDIVDSIISQDHYGAEQIHLLSIVSMFIASKFHEVSQLLLNEVVHDIGHNCFKRDQIRKTELFILKKLNLYLPKNYFPDFVYNLLRLISHKRNFLSKSSRRSEELSEIHLKRHLSAKQINYKQSQPKQIMKKPSLPLMIIRDKIDKPCRNLKLSISSEIEDQFEKIVFLFSMTVYKILSIEYDLYRKTDPILLFFSIVNFSIVHLNELLGFKSKFNNLTSRSKLCGINPEKLSKVTEKIKVIFHSCVNSKKEYTYLKEIELIYFLQ